MKYYHANPTKKAKKEREIPLATRGQMEPFSREDVQHIRSVLQRTGPLRDLTIFNVAIDTMLRGGDLMALRVTDVRDSTGKIVERFRVRQEKTSEAVTVLLTPATRKLIAQYIEQAGKWNDDYLFTRDSNVHGQPLTTVSLRRLVKDWAKLCHKDPSNFSSHSLRRTKASFMYRETGNIEAIRRLLGHTSIAHTQVYLGVTDQEVTDLALRFAM